MTYLHKHEVPKGVTLSPNNHHPTVESRRALDRYCEHIKAAAKRYPVVIGPSGVVFYAQQEYGLPADPMS